MSLMRQPTRSDTRSALSTRNSLDPKNFTDSSIVSGVPCAAEIDCLDDGNSGTPNGGGMDNLFNLFDAYLNVDKDDSTAKAKTSLSSRSFATAKDSISPELSADDNSTIHSCNSNNQPPNTTAFGWAFGNIDKLILCANGQLTNTQHNTL